MSNPYGGFNQGRIEPEPTPAQPQREGQAPTKQAASRYITKASELTPSEHRGTDINTDAIRDGVARMLALHDRQVAVDNGIEAWRVDAARLNAAVRAEEMTAAQAEQVFKVCWPNVTPEQVNAALGGQS